MGLRKPYAHIEHLYYHNTPVTYLFSPHAPKMHHCEPIHLFPRDIELSSFKLDGSVFSDNSLFFYIYTYLKVITHRHPTVFFHYKILLQVYLGLSISLDGGVWGSVLGQIKPNLFITEIVGLIIPAKILADSVLVMKSRGREPLFADSLLQITPETVALITGKLSFLEFVRSAFKWKTC